MRWPLSQEYNEAIQNPAINFSDPELCQGKARTNALGLPVPCSGNFADVYEVRTAGGAWAVKCFTRQIPGLRERYREIVAYLARMRVPFMVSFNYLDQGIQVCDQWYPVLKMDWVEGFTLNHFIKQNLDKPQVLENIAQLWVALGRLLRKASVAHCDLQHGNVMVVPGKMAGAFSIQLVDYDGMFVPTLTGQGSGELGHPAYQHPQRLRQGTYSAEVDRFSLLAIYCAIRSLIVGGRALWDRYDNGDNLLFRECDLRSPRDSGLFRDLLQLNDPEVRRLADSLSRAAYEPLEHAPLVEDLIPTCVGAQLITKAKPKGQTAPIPAEFAQPLWATMPPPIRLSTSQPPTTPAETAGSIFAQVMASSFWNAGAATSVETPELIFAQATANHPVVGGKPESDRRAWPLIVVRVMAGFFSAIGGILLSCLAIRVAVFRRPVKRARPLLVIRVMAGFISAIGILLSCLAIRAVMFGRPVKIPAQSRPVAQGNTSKISDRFGPITHRAADFRPCGGCERGAPFDGPCDAKRQCHFCWLFYNDPRYHKLYSGRGGDVAGGDKPFFTKSGQEATPNIKRTRPCIGWHREPIYKTGDRWVLGSGSCRICWLYMNDSGYRRWWGGEDFPDGIVRELGVMKQTGPPGQNMQYLSDMTEFDVKVADGRFAKKGELGYMAGNPPSGRILVNGKESPNGLSMCPDSNSYAAAKYKLAETAQTFIASVALNDSASAAGRPPGDGKIPTALIFLVGGDGTVLWRSKPVDNARLVQECNVNVIGVSFLELRVVCPGDSTNAQAVWLDPRVLLK